MKILHSKFLPLLLCMLLLSELYAPAALAANDAASVGDNTVPTTELTEIHIRSAQDLAELAQLCKLDSWSQDKLVLLEDSIDLSGLNFPAIPTFGGTFDGQGHTISGLNPSVFGETCGLFRYIQPAGVVKNLTVDGVIRSDTATRNLGSIAGSNGGTILRCQFLGEISGKSIVGGIVGTNEAGGQVIHCTSSGAVSGEHYIGGIAGRNRGTIVSSKNSGPVNTTEINPAIDLTQLDPSSIADIESTALVTDIGGIAGFSSGIIQSCENIGSVGFALGGYNVGGIAGRQCGHIDSCVNSGTILGRKDVGGIVGQMEPQLTLNYDQTALDLIWNELDALESAIDAFLADTNHSAGRITGKIRAVSDSAAAVKDSVADLSSAFTDWADGSINQINDASARISWTIERMVPVMDGIEDALAVMEQAADRFSEGLTQSSIAAEFGADAADEMSLALNDLQTAMTCAQHSLSLMDQAMELLAEALGDSEITEQALQDLSDAMNGMTDAFSQMVAGLGQLHDAMERVYEWIRTDPAWQELQSAVDSLGDAMQLVLTALQGISEFLENIANDTDLTDGAALMLSSVKNLSDGMDHLRLASRDLVEAYDEFRSNGPTSDVLWEHLDDAADDLNDALDDLDQAVDNLQSGFDLIENSLTVTEYIPELQAGLGELSDAMDAVSTAVTEISTALEKLEQSEVPDEEMANLRNALDSVLNSLGDAAHAAQQLGDAVNALIDNLDPGSVTAALSKLHSSIALLDAAAVSMSQAAGHLSKASKHLSSASLELADALDIFSEAGSLLSDSIGLLEGAADEASKTLTALAEMAPIRFDSLNGSVSDEGDTLNAATDALFDSFNALNSEFRAQAGKLTADLQGINAQMGTITDLLHQFQQELINKKAEDFLVDISGQNDNDDRSNGKISVCENYGSVEGNQNTAGITGSIGLEYDFTPEDDLTVHGARTLDFAVLVRAVVHDCVNHGPVTAKKSRAGGITGTMDLGYIFSCISYGSIAGGSYAGGIAGESMGGIADCWVRCTLSGSKFVGGVAGMGSLIRDCRTLVDLDPDTRYSGAVAGQITEPAELSGNYFLHRTLSGVDGISYAGKAEPLSSDAFRALDHCPKDFDVFELVFTADGELIDTIRFTYGDAVPMLPEIPKKAGHSAVWPELDYSYLTFGQVLEAQYIPYAAALADELTPHNVLITGSFSPDAALTVREWDAEWSDEKGTLFRETAHTVTVSDSEPFTDTFTLHWRLPEDSKYDLWLFENGGWIRREYTIDGSYLLLHFTGDSVSFCLTETQTHWLVYAIPAAALVLLFASVILIVCIKRRKKTASAA